MFQYWPTHTEHILCSLAAVKHSNKVEVRGWVRVIACSLEPTMRMPCCRSLWHFVCMDTRCHFSWRQAEGPLFNSSSRDSWLTIAPMLGIATSIQWQASSSYLSTLASLTYTLSCLTFLREALIKLFFSLCVNPHHLCQLWILIHHTVLIHHQGDVVEAFHFIYISISIFIFLFHF